MAKILFLDTNVYLHYRDVEQIDWLPIADAASVRIVVPPVTIRELNNQKDTHPHARIRRRAGNILKKLADLLTSCREASLRDGVDISLENREPMVDFERLRLSPSVQDDQLMASVVMQRDESPDTEVLLVTSDMGLVLRAKAQRLDIRTLKLPDELRLPEEPDPNEERIKQMEQEMRDLKARAPKLSLRFDDREQCVKFTLPQPVTLTDYEVQDKLHALMRQYPKTEHPSGKASEPLSPNSAAPQFAELARVAAMGFVPRERIKEYNSRLEEFYNSYAQYLQDQIRYENLTRRTVSLNVWLANEGTAPAEDIDVQMYVPVVAGLTRERDFPPTPPAPQPPGLPKTQLEELTEAVGASFKLPAFPNTPQFASVRPPPNVSSPTIKRVGSFEVHLHIQRLKHGLMEPFEALRATFESFEAASSFHVDYRVLAGNLPHETTGTLHVIVEKGDPSAV